MGCCFGKDEDDYEQDHAPRETSRLLGDPVRSNIGEGYSTMSPHAAGKDDEQSAMDNILTQAAKNVIDVTAVTIPNMDQGNYHDISLQYRNKINTELAGGRDRNYRLQYPYGVTTPYATLSAPPPSHADVHMITTAADRAASAVKELAIEHKEDLVVPFGVP